MIKKTLAIILIFIVYGNLALADFHTEFRAAVKLFKKRNFAEAEEAFSKLAKAAPEPKSKSKSLEYAVSSLRNLKKYDEALKVAGDIPREGMRKNAIMEILRTQRDYKKLLEMFKDENISAWEEDYIPKGYANRAFAHYMLRDYTEAAKDYEKSYKNAVENYGMVSALNWLAACHINLKDEDKALETYIKAIDASHNHGSHTFYRAVLSATGILTRQGKTKDALKIMEQLNLKGLAGGDWLVQGLVAYGDIYLKMGDPEKAMAKYNEAAEVKHANPHFINKAKEKIKQLENPENK